MKNEVTIQNAKIVPYGATSTAVTLTRAQLEAALKEINEPEINNVQVGDRLNWAGTKYRVARVPMGVTVTEGYMLVIDENNLQLYTEQTKNLNDPKLVTVVAKVGAPR